MKKTSDQTDIQHLVETLLREYPVEYRTIWQKSHSTQNFQELLSVFKETIEFIGPCFIVCGPVTSGGENDVFKNLCHLANVGLYYKQTHSVNIFPQLLFEESIHRIWNKMSQNGNSSSVIEDALFTKLYFPIFEHNLLEGPIFTPNWKTSNGANREHVWFSERADRYSIIQASQRAARHKGLTL